MVTCLFSLILIGGMLSGCGIKPHDLAAPGEQIGQKDTQEFPSTYPSE